MKISVIAWTRYDRRPDLLAQHLGTTAHFVSRGQRGRVLQAPLKYAQQWRDTWALLNRERPDVVFVQNPPIFAVAAAHLYARRTGARYVIDGHTAAFLSPKWRWSLPLFGFFARHAVTTLLTNEHLKSQVNGWGGHALILAFTPGEYPPGECYDFKGGASGARFNIAVVNTFAEDEPLGLVFQAAKQIPEVSFHVTGNPKRAPAVLLEAKPDNCHLTGYLPYEQYVALLRGSDAVMDLTTRNHTLLMGAYEAVSLGRPLIVSDWPVLKSYFSRGAVWVPNTLEGIRDGVCRARAESPALQRDVLVLRDQLQAEWDRGFAELKQLIGFVEG